MVQDDGDKTSEHVLHVTNAAEDKAHYHRNGHDTDSRQEKDVASIPRSHGAEQMQDDFLCCRMNCARRQLGAGNSKPSHFVD